jgi:hypothetical protein
MNQDNEAQKSRFAATYGSPGQAPRTLGPFRVFWPLIPFCLLAGWLLRAALPAPELNRSLAGGLLILLAMGLALFMNWSARRLQSFIKGAEGEEKVARELSFLPDSCTVFHDLQPSDEAIDIDHVVVAPAGLFVIETKNWNGAITFEKGAVVCNGRPATRPPLKQVREAAAALLHHLDTAGCPQVSAQPVLCFAGSPPDEQVSNVGGVRICTTETLRDLFENTVENPLPEGTRSMITAELIRCIKDERNSQ